MKKIVRLFALCGLAMAVFTACSNDGYEYEETPQTVTVTESNIVFPAEASTGSLTFKAEGNVTATCDKEWCTITTSGSTIQVSVTANPNLEGRMATITLTCGAGKTTAIVQQKGWVFNFDDATFTDLNWAGDTIVVEGSSTFACTGSSEQDWLTATTNADGNIVIVAAKNLDPAERTGTVTLTANGLTCTITLVQNTWEWSYEDGEYEVGYGEGTLEIDGYSEMEPTYESSVSWITATYENGKTTLHYEANPYAKARSGSIKIMYEGKTTATITLNQAYEVNFAGTYTLSYFSDAAETTAATATMVITRDEEDPNQYWVTGIRTGWKMSLVFDSEMNRLRLKQHYSVGTYGSYYAGTSIYYTKADGTSNYYSYTSDSNYDIFFDYTIDDEGKAHFTLWDSNELFNTSRRVVGFWIYAYKNEAMTTAYGAIIRFRRPTWDQQ